MKKIFLVAAVCFCMGGPLYAQTFSKLTIGEKTSTADLLRQLNSGDNVVVAKAVYFLKQRGEEARPATERLLELLGSKETVYFWAWGPESDYTDGGGRGFNSHNIGELALDLLAGVPSDPQALLAGIKSSNSSQFRINAIKLIGHWAGHDAQSGKDVSGGVIDFLISVIEENAGLKREGLSMFSAGCFALGKTKSKNAADFIITLYRKRSAGTHPLWRYNRNDLIRALGELGYKEATPLLVEELDKFEDYLKEDAFLAIGLSRGLIMALDGIGDPSSGGALALFLEQFDHFVQMDTDEEHGEYFADIYQRRWRDQHLAAIGLAGKLGAKEAVPALIDLLGRKEVRKTSAYALVRINDARAVGPLADIIEMTRSDISEQKLEAIRNSGSCSEIEPLLDCVRDYVHPSISAMPIQESFKVEQKRIESNRPAAPCKALEE
jgi:HEAT repeat protein